MMRSQQSPRFLAVSLLLFYVACILFGWQWANLRSSLSSYWPLHQFPQAFWPLGLSLSLMITGFFTKPLSALRIWMNRLFETDTRMFFGVICLTSLSILLLIHSAVLAEAVLILGVILLARFDLRLAKIRGWRQFAILGGIAIAGFLGGGCLHWVWLGRGMPWRDWWFGFWPGSGLRFSLNSALHPGISKASSLLSWLGSRRG